MLIFTNEREEASSKKPFGWILSCLALLSVGIWLFTANLGCRATDVWNDLNIVFSPELVNVSPGEQHSVDAKVLWAGSRVLDASWTVNGEGLSAIEGVNWSPRAGEQTLITFTGADASTLTGMSSRWVNASYIGERLPVVARFLDPTYLEDVWVTRKKYLALAVYKPFLSVEITKSKVWSSRNTYWGRVWVAAKAEVLRCPEDWRYDFDFTLKVILRPHLPNSYANTVVTLSGNELPVKVAEDKRSAAFSEVWSNFGYTEAVGFGDVVVSVRAEPQPGSGAKFMESSESFLFQY